MEEKRMNIYEKMQQVKLEISKRELKMTGKNTFSGYDYYQLGDFLPSVIELCTKYKLFTKITFKTEYGMSIDTKKTETSTETHEQKTKAGERAVLTIKDIDNPAEEIEYTCDVKDLTLKGANTIQNYGGVQTYLRRYLYMNAFDIVEGDMFDSDSFEKDKDKKKSKKELNDLIELEKQAFMGSNDEVKNKVGAQMKALGYASFAKLEEKLNKNDIVSLAKILNIEVPESLNNKKGTKNE